MKGGTLQINWHDTKPVLTLDFHPFSCLLATAGADFDIKVVVPKGSLCELKVKTNVGLPPDAIYNIVTDPDNRRVFKNIQEVTSRKVLLDEGSRQVVDLEQAAIWRFLWWSGTISVHVLVDQNKEENMSNGLSEL